MQFLATLVAGLEDVKPTVHFRHIDLTVGPHRRALGVATVFERPKQLAVGRIETVQLSALIADIEPAFMNGWGTVAHFDARLLPHQARLAVLDLRGVQTYDFALNGRIQVLSAV